MSRFVASVFSQDLQQNTIVDLARIAEGAAGRTLLYGSSELLPFLVPRLVDIEWGESAERARALLPADVKPWVQPVASPTGPYDTIILNVTFDDSANLGERLHESTKCLANGGRILVRWPRGHPLWGRRAQPVSEIDVIRALRGSGPGEWHPLPAFAPGWQIGAWARAEVAAARPLSPHEIPDPFRPRVTILMATHDRRALIEESLRSLTDQSIDDWEALIFDDGSSDGTAKYLDDLATADPRFRIFHGKQQGKGAALADAAGQARGDYVLFLDDDDLLAPRALEIFLSYCPDSTVIASDALLIDARGGIQGVRPTPRLHPRNVLRGLLEGCFLLQPTVFLSRDLLRSAGGMSPRYSRLVDYELWFRVFREASLDYVSLPLARVRRHGGNRRDRARVDEIRTQARRIFREVRKISAEERFPDLAIAASEVERVSAEMEATLELARALLRVGASAEAAEELRTGLSRHQNAVSLQCLLGRVLISEGNLEEASAIFRTLLKNHPHDGNALNGEALCRMAKKEWAAAEESLARLLASHPEHLVTRLNWLWSRSHGELSPELVDFHRGVLQREDPPGREYCVLDLLEASAGVGRKSEDEA